MLRDPLTITARRRFLPISGTGRRSSAISIPRNALSRCCPLLSTAGNRGFRGMALARTSVDKFVLLGADCAHHCGMFRPSPLTPLPETISPSPLEHPMSASVCPCSLFERAHPNPESFRTTPFYDPAAPMAVDPVAHRTTLDALKMLDASPDVFVILAHDASLLDVVEFFPTADLTGWEKLPSKKDVCQWRFLNDFRKCGDNARD
jgi:hypothetical protein